MVACIVQLYTIVSVRKLVADFLADVDAIRGIP